MPEDGLKDSILSMPLQEMVTFRISRLHARLSAQAAEILKKNGGISLMQWRILVMLETHGAITPAEIVRQTELDKGQLSRTIKGMVEQGLITSTPSESDQRSHVLGFTEKGLQVFRTARPHMRHRQMHLLSSLTDEERAATFAALEKLEAAADSLEAEL